MTRSLLRRLSAPAVLVAALVWAPLPAHAVRDGEKALFGPIGAIAGQVLRINVYGIGNPNDAQRTFLIRLFDVRGQMVGERRLELMPGAIGVEDFRIGDGGISPGPSGRRTLRAEIVGFDPQPDSPTEWFTTLEVINARTGRTTILLGGPDTTPAPQ